MQKGEIGLLPYVRLHDEMFPDDPTTTITMALALRALCRFDEVVQRYGSDPHLVFESLAALGRADEAVRRVQPGTWQHRSALLFAGMWDELPEGTWERGSALLWQGKPAEALAENRSLHALIANGQYDEALSSSDRKDRGTALRDLGRLDEAVAIGDMRAMVQTDIGPSILEHAYRYPDVAYACSYLAMRAFVRGDREGFARYLRKEREIPASLVWENYWIHHYVLLPLMEELLGDAGALTRSLGEGARTRRPVFDGMLSYAARFILGEIGDEEFLAQPRKWCVEGRLHVCRGVRAERLGDHGAARASYRAFLELPLIARKFEAVIGDPLVEMWARVRAATA